MKIAHIQDQILRDITKIKYKDFGSTYYSKKLNVPHHSVSYSLEKMRDKGHIELLETSEMGYGDEKTYSLKRAMPAGLQFYKSNGRAYRTQKMWEDIIFFLKNYWVIITFIASSAIALYFGFHKK